MQGVSLQRVHAFSPSLASPDSLLLPRSESLSGTLLNTLPTLYLESPGEVGATGVQEPVPHFVPTLHQKPSHLIAQGQEANRPY